MVEAEAAAAREASATLEGRKKLAASAARQAEEQADIARANRAASRTPSPTKAAPPPARAAAAAAPPPPPASASSGSIEVGDVVQLCSNPSGEALYGPLEDGDTTTVLNIHLNHDGVLSCDVPSGSSGRKFTYAASDLMRSDDGHDGQHHQQQGSPAHRNEHSTPDVV